jgi:V/A-type H+-transporting ATPase subunit D
MAKIALNKSELHRQTSRLKTFKKFLPSLELKRKQIIAERNKARTAVQESRGKIEDIYRIIEQDFPVLSSTELDPGKYIQLIGAKTSEENVVGVYLPKLEGYEVTVDQYGYLTSPVWTERLFGLYEKLLALEVEFAVNEKRLSLLEKALQKTTQRLNLFDKVLIPETQENIRKIKIYLSDFERAAVVQAKIAKQKNEIKAKEEAQADNEAMRGAA